MEDVLAHGFEYRPRLLQRRRLAADHEGQGAGRGAGGAAGHRGVQQFDAACLGRRVHLARGLGGDGGALQHQAAGSDGFQQAAIAQQQPLHMLAGGQHGDHHLRTADGVPRIPRGRGAFGGQFVDGRLHQVVDREPVAGLEQVAGHGQAHVAKSDKGDLAHRASPWPGPRRRLVVRDRPADAGLPTPARNGRRSPPAESPPHPASASAVRCPCRSAGRARLRGIPGGGSSSGSWRIPCGRLQPATGASPGGSAPRPGGR
ncbi:hypothetical protein D9M70_494970 [compost metagenome]